MRIRIQSCNSALCIGVALSWGVFGAKVAGALPFAAVCATGLAKSHFAPVALSFERLNLLPVISIYLLEAGSSRVRYPDYFQRTGARCIRTMHV
jgi:hypothetical protein